MKHNYYESYEYMTRIIKLNKELKKSIKRRKILAFIEKILIKIGL